MSEKTKRVLKILSLPLTLALLVFIGGCAKSEIEAASQPISPESRLWGTSERKSTNTKGEVRVDIWAWDLVKDFSFADPGSIPESADVALTKFRMTLKSKELSSRNDKDFPIGTKSRVAVVDSESEFDYFEKEDGSDIFYMKTQSPEFGILGVKYVGRDIKEIFSEMKIVIPPSEQNADYFLFGRKCSYILTVRNGICKEFAMSSEL